MADTKLPAYLPYPRFLLKMEISQTAKLLYALLLDRSTLSQKNKWQDGEGRIYIIYPIAEIAEILDKGSTTIKGALNELDTADNSLAKGVVPALDIFLIGYLVGHGNSPF